MFFTFQKITDFIVLNVRLLIYIYFPGEAINTFSCMVGAHFALTLQRPSMVKRDDCAYSTKPPGLLRGLNELIHKTYFITVLGT